MKPSHLNRMSEDGIAPDAFLIRAGHGNGASSSGSSGQDDMQQDGKPVIGVPGAPAGNSVGRHGSSSVSTASLAADGQSVEYLIKFETQMYKMRDEEYAIDVQVSTWEGGRNILGGAVLREDGLYWGVQLGGRMGYTGGCSC